MKRIGCKESLSPLAAPCARVYVNNATSSQGNGIMNLRTDFTARGSLALPDDAVTRHHGQDAACGCAGPCRVLS